MRHPYVTYDVISKTLHHETKQGLSLDSNLHNCISAYSLYH